MTSTGEKVDPIWLRLGLGIGRGLGFVLELARAAEGLLSAPSHSLVQANSLSVFGCCWEMGVLNAWTNALESRVWHMIFSSSIIYLNRNDHCIFFYFWEQMSIVFLEVKLNLISNDFLNEIMHNNPPLNELNMIWLLFLTLRVTESSYYISSGYF